MLQWWGFEPTACISKTTHHLCSLGLTWALSPNLGSCKSQEVRSSQNWDIKWLQAAIKWIQCLSSHSTSESKWYFGWWLRWRFHKRSDFKWHQQNREHYWCLHSKSIMGYSIHSTHSDHSEVLWSIALYSFTIALHSLLTYLYRATQARLEIHSSFAIGWFLLVITQYGTMKYNISLAYKWRVHMGMRLCCCCSPALVPVLALALVPVLVSVLVSAWC